MLFSPQINKAISILGIASRKSVWFVSVPRRRTHSGRRSSALEHKENLLFTPPTTSCSRVPISESPATKMSKLSFDVNSSVSVYAFVDIISA